MKQDWLKSLTGLGEITAIVVFMLSLIAYFSFGDFIKSRVDLSSTQRYIILFGVLYVGAQLLAVIIDLLQGQHRATVKNFFILWWSYLFITFIRLLMLVMMIPLLALLFLIGPIAFIGGFISIILLLIYSVQNIIGIDWVANPPSSEEAGYALLFVLFIGILLRVIKKNNSSEDDLMDRFADFYVRWIYEPADRWNQSWLLTLDK